MRSRFPLALSLLVPLLSSCDAEKIANAQETCDAYRACLADVSPDASAAAETSYGEDSACWDNGKSAEPCGSACADALNVAHLAHPASEACDDGTAIPSDRILTDRSWSLPVTASEGQYCATFSPEVSHIQFQFAPDSDSAFPGTLTDLGFFTFNLVGECTNDAVRIRCAFEHSEGALVFEGVLSDDLAEMTGSFDYAGNCMWTLDSAA